MSQTKVKKENLKRKYTEVVTEKWTQNLTGKLKEFKTWVQVKSPKTLQPALSYALDWLAPELLGTGFRMFEMSDLQMKAIIPANKTNLDSQFEIHQGLVTNAVLELAKTFVKRQMPDQFFQITSSELNLVKKQKWDSELNLVLKVSHHQLDDFFILLQKNKKAWLEIEIEIEIKQAPIKAQIGNEKLKKDDFASLKLHFEMIDLIA